MFKCGCTYQWTVTASGASATRDWGHGERKTEIQTGEDAGTTKGTSVCLFVCCLWVCFLFVVLWCAMSLFLYGLFCHGALKLDTICHVCNMFSVNITVGWLIHVYIQLNRLERTYWDHKNVFIITRVPDRRIVNKWFGNWGLKSRHYNRNFLFTGSL